MSAPGGSARKGDETEPNESCSQNHAVVHVDGGVEEAFCGTLRI
jgi:hypothetical protein